MLIGQTILADDAAATTVYSPWFPRRGNAATFVLEVIVASTATVTVTMQTKNSEDPRSRHDGDRRHDRADRRGDEKRTVTRTSKNSSATSSTCR